MLDLAGNLFMSLFFIIFSLLMLIGFSIILSEVIKAKLIDRNVFIVIAAVFLFTSLLLMYLI